MEMKFRFFNWDLGQRLEINHPHTYFISLELFHYISSKICEITHSIKTVRFFSSNLFWEIFFNFFFTESFSQEKYFKTKCFQEGLHEIFLKKLSVTFFKKNIFEKVFWKKKLEIFLRIFCFQEKLFRESFINKKNYQKFFQIKIFS